LLKYLTIISFLLISIAPAHAKEPCAPKEDLISNLLPKKTSKCLHSIWFALGRKNKIDPDFTFRFIKTLLPTSKKQLKKHSSLSQFDIDYIKLAETISLLDSKELIKRYTDFIVYTSSSADELRSFGLGKLYSLKAPEFLNILSSYSKNEQKTLIRRLSWGLANNYYPNINKSNYKRLIIGGYWELIDNNNSQRLLSKKVEDEVLKIIGSY